MNETQAYINKLIGGDTKNIPYLSEKIGVDYNTIYYWYRGKHAMKDWQLKMFKFWYETFYPND